MPLIRAPHEFNVGDLYVDLSDIAARGLYLKCEGFNFAGSIKLKAAAEMVAAAQRGGWLHPGSVLVESSSGNLGVALSMILAGHDLRFECVTDVRCNPAAVRLMRSYGAVVHVVTEPGPDGGFLGARLELVRALCERDERYVWLNQYANPDNWGAHYRTTGPEIVKQFPDLDVLFVGAGTTGTLMGCARYIRDEGLPITVVAIDPVGSVTFGAPAGRRLIPGLGTSTPPQILDKSYVDDLVYVSEPDSIAMCRRLAGRGFLFGGSTGTVVAGALRWLSANRSAGLSVMIAPDLGERYLDSIYDEGWRQENYPEVAAVATAVSGGLRMTTDIVAHKAQIRDVVCEVFEIDADELTETASFEEDLGVDSLGVIDLLAELERTFAIEIDQEQAARMVDLPSVYEVVAEAFGTRAPAQEELASH